MIDLGLNEAIEAALPHACRERLSRLCAWDFSAVRGRVASRLGWSKNKAIRVEREYARFLALMLIEPHTALGMAGPVDEFWHEHILNTRDYHRLCSEVIGRFIHHDPVDQSVSRAEDPYLQATLPALAQTFGTPSRRYWPSKCGGGGVRRQVSGHRVQPAHRRMSALPTSNWLELFEGPPLDAEEGSPK